MAETNISGDSVLNDIRKDLAREVNTGSRTFYLGVAWSVDSKLFETVVLQADVVLDCGATETAGGVEAVQILVDAVKQGFSDSRVEVESLDRPALSRVWLLTPMGWISIYTLEAENGPVLAGMHLLENHDISFRRNEFLVYDAEGHTRSVPLRRFPSGHRILNPLFLGQREASRFSHATAGDFFEDPREQNLNVSSACMFGLSQHPCSRVCHHSNPASVTSHRSSSISVSAQSDFVVFPHENVCQPSSLQSKLRSIKNTFELVANGDGQKGRRTLVEMSKSHRSRLDTSFCTRWSGSSQLASDKTLSRTTCIGAELHCKPTRSVDKLCEMCPSSTLHSSSHCSNDVSVDSVIGFSAGGSEANVTFERQRLHGEGGKGHDCRSRETEASKEEANTTNDDRVQHCVQFRSSIQCDDKLGNSSAHLSPLRQLVGGADLLWASSRRKG